MTPNELITEYLKLRDYKESVTKKVTEALVPTNERMEQIEKELQSSLDSQGLDNFKCEAGTAYKTTSRSVKMKDQDAFKRFVFAPAIDTICGMWALEEKEAVINTLLSHTLFDMIDFRVGKKGIVEHLESTGEVVPGVSFDTFTQVNIRR